MSAPNKGLDDYCRLFILGGKGNTEDEFREMFNKYGTVKDVWILKDRHNNQDKGITYIQMNRPSEAALAIEEMNGKFMPNNPKPLRVLLASNRKEGSVRDPKEDEKMLRLFIIIPKDYETADVEKSFRDYGDIDYVRIIRDRNTNKSKGLAYVKYYRAYCAAVALEKCDSEYKAIFADTKNKPEGNQGKRQDRWSEPGGRYEYSERGPMPSPGGNFSSNMPERRDPAPNRGHHDSEPMDMLRNYSSAGETRLEALIGGNTSEENVFRLFDIVPGLDVCNFDRSHGIAYVKYMSSECASYARDKLNGFEYPPGYRMQVRYAAAPSSGSRLSPGPIRRGIFDQPYDFTSDNIGDSVSGLKRSIDAVGCDSTADTLQALVNSIQKATSVLERAGLSGDLRGQETSGGASSGGLQRVRYCNLDLPPPRPIVPKDTPAEDRLFIVSQPSAFPEHILSDLFCRFGGLIDAYFMPGKNFGYVKYASKESAMDAIKILHGQRICDMRLKVMEAEPMKYSGDGEGSHKRPRT